MDSAFVHLSPMDIPFTEALHRNIRLWLHNRVDREANAGDSDKVCLPAHWYLGGVVSYGLVQLMTSQGARPKGYEQTVGALHRALTDNNSFWSFVPKVARYVGYLQIMNHMLNDPNGAWFDDRAVRMELKIGLRSTESQEIDIIDWFVNRCNEPDPFDDHQLNEEIDRLLPCLLSLEDYWLALFAALSEMLGESRADLIPDFYLVERVGDSPKEHPVWIELRSQFEDLMPELPFLLSFRPDSEDRTVLWASSQGGWLYQRLISCMALWERRINSHLMETFKIWRLMRASHAVEPEQIDVALRTRLDWQREIWTEAYLRDAKLSTTDMRIAHIQPWGDQDAREDMIERRKRIDRVFKRLSEYVPGNKGRVEKGIPPEVTQRITQLIPDLREILKVAWPKETADGSREYSKALDLADRGELLHIKRNHLTFIKTRWKSVKENDRLDLCSKIVAEYLEAETGTRYHLASLRKHINLPRQITKKTLTT